MCDNIYIMVTVIFTQGLPASGKTTWAKEMTARYPPGGAARLNNDELAGVLFGSPWAGMGKERAIVLTKTKTAALKALLESPRTQLVILDNTHLRQNTITPLAVLALQYGADVQLNQTFLNTPLSVCLERNAARVNPVPEHVIMDMNAGIMFAEKCYIPII
jgi:predicted kinase